MDNKTLRDFVWNALPQMENSNSNVSPYQASYAQLGNSGLSFGHMQLDVGSGNKIALNCFTKIMKSQIGKKFDGKIIKQDDFARIISEAQKKGKKFPGDTWDLGVVNQALAANQQAIDTADKKQFEKVMGDLEVAFAAAARNPNGPGDLNSVAPDPSFITELAAWANMNPSGLTGKTDKFLKETTLPISQNNYDTYCFHTTTFWKTQTTKNFRDNWPGRITAATGYAEKQIGADVYFFNDFNSLDIANAPCSNTGSNYISVWNGPFGVSGCLWAFKNLVGNDTVAGEVNYYISANVLRSAMEGYSPNGCAFGTCNGIGDVLSLINDPQLQIASETKDNAGNLLTSSKTVYGESGVIISTDNTTNTYDASGNKLSTSEAKTDFVGTDPNNPSKAAATDITTSKYNDSGSLSANSEDKIDASGNITITENTKDAKGNPKASIVIKMDAKGNMTATATTYDAKGNPLTNTEKQTDSGTGITDTLNGYASDGTPFSSKASNGNLIYNGTYTSIDGGYTDVNNASYNTATVLYKRDTVYAEFSPGVATYTITPNPGGGYTENWSGPGADWGWHAGQQWDGIFITTANHYEGTFNTSTLAYNCLLDGVWILREPWTLDSSIPRGYYELPYPWGTATANYSDIYNPGNNMTTITTYGGGGYQQNWYFGWDKVEGAYGENNRLANGSYNNYLENPDGSFICSAYDAATSVTKSTFNDGNGGYQYSWTKSDGSYGERDQLDNGSFTDTVNKADGSAIMSVYDAVSGVTEEDQTIPI